MPGPLPALPLLAQSTAPRETWPGSANHLVAVAVCAALMLAIVLAGRRLRAAGTEGRFRPGLGVFGVAAWLVLTFYYILEPDTPDWSEALPLHFCDVANLLAGIVMLTAGRFRILSAVLYFWAFALTVHGFITPVVEEGPADPRYHLFWLNHSIVVGYAIYDLAVAGYRPSFRDVLTASAATLGYAGAMLILNLATGFNYGFVGPTEPAPGVIGLLGPWPLRLLWIVLFGFACYLVVWAPVPIAQAIARKRSEGEEGLGPGA